MAKAGVDGLSRSNRRYCLKVLDECLSRSRTCRKPIS